MVADYINVYCYNNQSNITIDYATGDSRHNNDTVKENKEETKEEVTKENNRVDEPAQSQVESVYILNTNTKKIHLPTCSIACEKYLIPLEVNCSPSTANRISC